MIYTVFFNEESGEMPQDFSTRDEALRYATEKVEDNSAESFDIQETKGEIV